MTIFRICLESFDCMVCFCSLLCRKKVLSAIVALPLVPSASGSLQLNLNSSNLNSELNSDLNCELNLNSSTSCSNQSSELVVRGRAELFPAAAIQAVYVRVSLAPIDCLGYVASRAALWFDCSEIPFAVIARSVERLAQEHEVLRWRFVLDDSMPFGVAAFVPPQDTPLTVIDVQLGADENVYSAVWRASQLPHCLAHGEAPLRLIRIVASDNEEKELAAIVQVPHCLVSLCSNRLHSSLLL